MRASVAVHRAAQRAGHRGGPFEAGETLNGGLARQPAQVGARFGPEVGGIGFGMDLVGFGAIDDHHAAISLVGDEKIGTGAEHAEGQAGLPQPQGRLAQLGRGVNDQQYVRFSAGLRGAEGGNRGILFEPGAKELLKVGQNSFIHHVS